MDKEIIMKILLTNDDGYLASGINALFAELTDAGHDVHMVAPEKNLSGASHSIKIVEYMELVQINDKVHYVTSTPADSVRLGLQAIFQHQLPDVVISGINMGENITNDVLYSGTIGAAREAVISGITGIAFSMQGPQYNHVRSAAKVATALVNQISKEIEKFATPVLWNVNIPNQPYANIKGFKFARIGKRKGSSLMIKQITPRGNIIYWQGNIDNSFCGNTTDIDTDIAILSSQEYATITPLAADPVLGNTDHVASFADRLRLK